MRAVALHEDVLVLTSRLWQTNATALRAGGECMLLDAPYFPDELEMLPGVLGQAGFRPDALLATHADYDHLLARLPFPDLPLGVGETTMERIRAQPGEAQRELREEDARNYVTRGRPLGLGGVRALPVPGKLELGSGGDELELHPAEGHAPDGTAVFMPSAAVLVCGDYLSDVEIPLIAAAGSLPAYRSTLERLEPLVRRAASMVPGHGSPQTREGALGLLEADVAYLAALEAGREELPRGRDTSRQREIHADNVLKHAS
ncbi:MAG TPA: MBL fold metallo-hydrolase [Thermoleophilaceae bacterium]|nr:MBL fold metallo-hydrolase [Thermoleophilaceae bacterium]